MVSAAFSTTAWFVGDAVVVVEMWEKKTKTLVGGRPTWARPTGHNKKWPESISMAPDYVGVGLLMEISRNNLRTTSATCSREKKRNLQPV